MRKATCSLIYRGSLMVLLPVLVVAVLVCVTSRVEAAGEDDSSFGGGDGVVPFGPPSTFNQGLGIALQCDGKIIVAGLVNGAGESGELGVIRLNPDGSFDSSFATGGVYSVSFNFYGDIGWDVAIQDDGRIVVVGTSVDGLMGSSFLVMRLTAGGTLDPTFSGNGFHVFQFDGTSSARALAIQDDGGIVVVGKTNNTTAMAIARLTPSGELDTTFDGDGMVLIDFTQGDDDAWDVVIQDDGRIVVAGTVSVPGGSVFAVVRLLSDGALDTSFGIGGGGAAAIDFGTYSEGRGVDLQEDGKIVVAGFTDTDGSIAVGRLDTSGILDTSFDGDGMALWDISGSVDKAWDVTVQADGRIVVFGTVGMIPSLPAFLRMLPDGSPDLTLPSGVATVSFGSEDGWIRAGAVQPHDGKLLATGIWDVSSTPYTELFVLRNIGDDELLFRDGFECGGTAIW